MWVPVVRCESHRLKLSPDTPPVVYRYYSNTPTLTPWPDDPAKVIDTPWRLDQHAQWRSRSWPMPKSKVCRFLTTSPQCLLAMRDLSTSRLSQLDDREGYR